MYPPGSDIPESRLDEDPTKPDTETKQPPVGAVVEQYALDGGASEVGSLRCENGQLKREVKRLKEEVASLWLASSQLEAPAVEAELADIKSRMATAASHAQLDKSRGDDRNMTLDKLIQCHEQLADFSEARTQNSSASNEIHRRAPKDCWPSLINWAQSRDEDSLYHRLLDQVNGFWLEVKSLLGGLPCRKVVFPNEMRSKRWSLVPSLQLIC